MIEFMKARSKHKDQVLKLLDEFCDVCSELSGENCPPFTRAQNEAQEFYDICLNNDLYFCILAFDEDKLVGIVTANIVPKLRSGKYFAEIEELYVKKKYRGDSIAKRLLDKLIGEIKQIYPKVSSLRLESGNELLRAHRFYEKYGFVNYGYAFKYEIN